jgi:hypothetical protein
MGGRQKRSLLLRSLPAIGIVGAAVAGLFVWQNENSQRGLGAGLATVEASDYLPDLDKARAVLAAEINRHAELATVGASDGLAPPLRQPLRDLLECIDKANQDLDLAEAKPNREFVAKFDDCSSEIAECRATYDATAALVAKFDAATRDLAQKPVAELSALVKTQKLTRENPELEARRDALDKEVERLRSRRSDEVAEMRSMFLAGAADLTELRSRIDSARGEYAAVGEDDLVKTLAALRASLEVAEKLQRQLGDWSLPDPLTKADIDALNGKWTLAEAIDREVATTTDLAAWWNALRADRERAWANQLVAAYRNAHLRLTEKLKAVPASGSVSSELLEEHKRYDDLRIRWAGVISAMRTQPQDTPPDAPRLPFAVAPVETSPGPVPAPLPEGWPDERFESPAGVQSLLVRPGEAEAERLFASDFLQTAAKAKLRLWFFPGRFGLGDKPVYQAFVADPSGAVAALVDIHPVTFGEIRRDEHRRFNLPGNKYVLNAMRGLLPETLFFNTSAESARVFASSVDVATRSDPQTFRLPPSGWREWAWGGPLPIATLPVLANNRPKLALPFLDAAKNGAACLTCGVKEWVVRDDVTESQGFSEIAADPADVSRRSDTGIRLAVWLKRR